MSDFTLGSTEEKKLLDLNKKIVEIKKKIQLSGINDIKICIDIYIYIFKKMSSTITERNIFPLSSVTKRES